MSVWAVSLVRDEADVIEHTVTRMRQQVDQVLVADNGSTDGTREILERLDVAVIDDPEPGYYQSQKMTALAQRAAAAGATFVVPFDADEVWLCGEGRVADALEQLPAEALIAEAALFDHVPTAQDPEGDPISRIGWRRTQQAPLRKVACRTDPGLTIHQGNHSATYDGVRHPLTVTDVPEVRHFPYRSAEQMVRKARNGAAAYAATDLPEEIGAHWRGYGRIVAEQGEEALHEVFRRWFWSPDPENDGTLTFDPCP